MKVIECSVGDRVKIGEREYIITGPDSYIPNHIMGKRGERIVHISKNGECEIVPNNPE